MLSNNCNLDLVVHLRSLLGLLELDPNSQFWKDTTNLCDFLERETFRITVFAPFNHGKSTLLNALLGSKTLPIDLIPTTGAAIKVSYGEKLKTTIVLKDGTEVNELGTKILQDYAILNGDRQMRDDVKSVTVYANHPWLSEGIELLDLPGTNDRESQNILVKDQLITANLIINVLDARKLMTLEEREHLRDWLENRGINTVIFVVNFLNLLASEEQKQVQNRLRFVAESFRSQLPNNISNLYRVDALPALRARLKGDMAAAKTSGLVTFETALRSIVDAQKNNLRLKDDRASQIIAELVKIGREKQQQIESDLVSRQEKQQRQIEIKQKAEQLIKQGLQRSISEFESWLYLPSLRSRFGSELSEALQHEKFADWHREFSQTVTKYQQAVIKWVEKGCEFFEREKPESLLINFPQLPKIEVDSPQNNLNSDKEDDSVASVAIPGGIGFVLGGPVGAVVLGSAGYILNKMSTQTDEPNLEIEKQLYADAADNYLTQFNDSAFSILKTYHERSRFLISFESVSDDKTIQTLSHQLELLKSLLANIEQTSEYQQRARKEHL